MLVRQTVELPRARFRKAPESDGRIVRCRSQNGQSWVKGHMIDCLAMSFHDKHGRHVHVEAKECRRRRRRHCGWMTSFGRLCRFCWWRCIIIIIATRSRSSIRFRFFLMMMMIIVMTLWLLLLVAILLIIQILIIPHPHGPIQGGRGEQVVGRSSS